MTPEPKSSSGVLVFKTTAAMLTAAETRALLDIATRLARAPQDVRARLGLELTTQRLLERWRRTLDGSRSPSS